MAEKAGSNFPRAQQAAPSQSRAVSCFRLVLLAGIVLFALNSLPSHSHPLLDVGQRSKEESATRLQPAHGEFSWADLTPSRNFSWVPCYDDFECARFDVPMDWQDPSDEERVVLAVTRLPAANRKDYRGPIFFNPGGPGGSGIWSIRNHGRLLQKIVGDNHDIITFDPRGVGKSVPRVQCWHDYQREHVWKLQDLSTVDAHSMALYDNYARAQAFSKLCEEANAPSGILQHLGTASHARDMLAMLDALGEAQLRYWGFSYGTILGGTFAAMYPDRVGRLVSDGNVDYNEWYHMAHVNFLRDTDKVMAAFHELCHRAGPQVCAFYAESPAAIEARLDKLLARLLREPVMLPASVPTRPGGPRGPGLEVGPEVPEIVTYSKVRRMISGMLYQPQRKFEVLAEILAALDDGDARAYYEHMTRQRKRIEAVCAADSFLPPTEPPPGLVAESTADAFPAILCSDRVPVTGGVEDFAAMAAKLQEISHVGGAIGVVFHISCVGREVRPKFRFAGPFAGNTSFPILYVNNMADNVTPLVSARNNSAGFPSSVVLVQKAYGHTTLASPSTCTAQHIRAYFQDGVLPAPGTECEPDLLPFGLEAKKATNEADEELSRAIHALSEAASSASWPFEQTAYLF